MVQDLPEHPLYVLSNLCVIHHCRLLKFVVQLPYRPWTCSVPPCTLPNVTTGQTTAPLAHALTGWSSVLCVVCLQTTLFLVKLPYTPATYYTPLHAPISIIDRIGHRMSDTDRS
jgi:hypothetical protein